MKTYRGTRNKGGDVTVTVETGTGKAKPLAMRLDLRRHSPTGFNWGYAGSGPAQLALALCADALDDDERALRVYQRVKGELLVNAPDQQRLYLSHEQVMEAIEIVEQEHARNVLEAVQSEDI